MGEHEEWESLYPEFARIAREENFPKIATAFKLITTIEADHEARYLKLLDNIEKEQVFSRPEKQSWICRKCGHVHYGNKALNNCPVCDHPVGYFEIKAENY